jgi:gluconokinase
MAGEAFAPDLLLEGHADAEVLALAAQVPAGSDGLIMLPYVLSERAPLWDPDITGAFLGGFDTTTRAATSSGPPSRVSVLQVSIIGQLARRDITSPVNPGHRRTIPFRVVAACDGCHPRPTLCTSKPMPVGPRSAQQP